MAIVPNTRLGKIEFYEAHIQPWAANAANIGLTSAQVAALMSQTAAARVAYNQAQAARDAAKAATQTFYNAVGTMADHGAGLIKTIKSYAETQDDPNVYVLAQIPPPAEPSPVPAPGTPYQPRVSLMQSGELALRWKCDNPAGSTGTMYEVQRRVGDGPYVFVGSVGERIFADESLPAGSASVVYKVTAVRSTKRGEPALFVVNFGVGGVSVFTAPAGEQNEAGEPGESVRLAA